MLSISKEWRFMQPDFCRTNVLFMGRSAASAACQMGLVPHLTGVSPPTHRFRLFDLEAVGWGTYLIG